MDEQIYVSIDVQEGAEKYLNITLKVSKCWASDQNETLKYTLIENYHEADHDSEEKGSTVFYPP